MSSPLLELVNIHAVADDVPILRGVDLTVEPGEVHAIMGHPGYRLTDGEIRLKGEDVTGWSADERARAGVFLAFQYPEAIAGVSVVQFLRQAMVARRGLSELSVLEVRLALAEWMDRLGMDPAFAERHLNQGFSGGERKRNEVLQMALLEPDVALLDETDSGLDIDALRVVARGVQTVRAERPAMGAIVVTHYVKLLEEIEPDHVHVLVDGRIVHSGGVDVAAQIDREGYDAWRVLA